MARPREFDEVDALARARDAFWSHGVAATSVAELSEATGLSVGSIYKAFTSKDRLCQLTLDDYLRRARAELAVTFEQGPTPWASVRAWLDAEIDRASDPSPTRGCYAVELATERAAVDEHIRSLLVEHDGQMRRLVTGVVAAAVDAGEVSGDPAAVARLICTTVNGLQVEARKGITEAEARGIIDTMLAALEST